MSVRLIARAGPAFGVLVAASIATADIDGSDRGDWYVAPLTGIVVENSDGPDDTGYGLHLGFGRRLSDRWNLEIGLAGDRVDGVDQVVDLINRGSARCDVDISGTANASADIEPSVVLGPGEIGHVWVSDRGGCDRTTADPQVEFDVVVNGVVYPMATTFVAYCGVQLWAFFTD